MTVLVLLDTVKIREIRYDFGQSYANFSFLLISPPVMVLNPIQKAKLNVQKVHSCKSHFFDKLLLWEFRPMYWNVFQKSYNIIWTTFREDMQTTFRGDMQKTDGFFFNYSFFMVSPPPQKKKKFIDLGPQNLTTCFTAENFSNKTCGEFLPHVLLLKIFSNKTCGNFFFKHVVTFLPLVLLLKMFSNKTCG